MDELKLPYEEPKLLFSDRNFVEFFNIIQQRVHQNAMNHQWHDLAEKPQATDIAVQLSLIHSEVSEALEAIRISNPVDEKLPDFTCYELELADIVIRTMDLAEWCGLDLAKAIVAKMEYNRSRPIKHGGKCF